VTKSREQVIEIIGEIDPDVFKCHDCGQWLPISELSPHCKTCHPDPYQSFTMPLMRRVFPTTIAKELVSIQPLPKPMAIQYGIKAKCRPDVGMMQ